LNVIIDELEFFMAVVEERGFSAAAARLDTTTASVSRRIKALEQLNDFRRRNTASALR